jgi:hypothetical protein
VAEAAEVDAEQRPQAAAVAPAAQVQPADAVELQQVERQLQVAVDAAAQPRQRAR